MAAGIGEDLCPGVLGVGQHHGDELACLVAGYARAAGLLGGDGVAADVGAFQAVEQGQRMTPRNQPTTRTMAMAPMLRPPPRRPPPGRPQADARAGTAEAARAGVVAPVFDVAGLPPPLPTHASRSPFAPDRTIEEIGEEDQKAAAAGLHAISELSVPCLP